MVMIKKLVMVMMMSLFITQVMAYGGGGSAGIVFNIDTENRNNVKYEVTSFNINSNNEDIEVNCLNNTLSYKNLFGREIEREIRSNCNFILELEKGGDIEVYIGDKAFGVMTNEYGNLLNITIDGITYETITNAIKLYDSFVKEEEKEIIIKENNNMTINETNSEIINISLNNSYIDVNFNNTLNDTNNFTELNNSTEFIEVLEEEKQSFWGWLFRFLGFK